MAVGLALVVVSAAVVAAQTTATGDAMTVERGPRAEIGVIGGSGFYSFLEGAEDVVVETPYGAPSGPVSLGEVARTPGRLPAPARAAPRAPAARDQLPRQRLGAPRPSGCVRCSPRAPSAGCGPTSAPGDVVVPDQLVDRTTRRVSSFVESGAVHVPFADPYCPRLTAPSAAADDGVTVGGTMVVVEGPRFSTRAESQHYAAQGWSLVNMTGHPEAVLARELRQCYAAIALVTDLDAGVESGAGVGQEEVFALFAANLDRLRGLLADVIAAAPDPAGCTCATWADGLTLTYEVP